MLGFILFYFVGKAFYKLAEEYNKHKWGFAIAGVASYYAGVLIGGVLIGVFLALANPSWQEDQFSDTQYGLMAIPFGVLSTWGLYKILSRTWKKTSIIDSSEVLDSQLGQ